MGEDLSFKKITNRLRRIHIEFPDLRFGQVVQAALDKASNTANVDFHNLSSKKIWIALGEYRRELRDKKGDNK